VGICCVRMGERDQRGCPVTEGVSVGTAHKASLRICFGTCWEGTPQAARALLVPGERTPAGSVHVTHVPSPVPVCAQMSDPIETRRREEEERGGAISTLEYCIRSFSEAARSPDPRYSHIDPADKEKVKKRKKKRKEKGEKKKKKAKRKKERKGGTWLVACILNESTTSIALIQYLGFAPWKLRAPRTPAIPT